MSSKDPSIDRASTPSTPADANPPQTESRPNAALISDVSIRQNPTESDTKMNFSPPGLTPASPLTSRQQNAISLLISGRNVTSVAAALGIHRSTIYEWKRDPHFAAELADRQHEIRHTSDMRLRRILLQASQVALDSISSKRSDRYRNAFRLLTVMRPYHAIINQPEPPFPNDDEVDQAPCD